MPLYTVSSRDRISPSLRPEIAQMIVDTHCGLTDAPATFVNVIFSEGVPLRAGIDFQVFGSVRGGRTAQMNRELQERLHERAAKLLAIGPETLETSLYEVPASWVMEGGHVLPEPGEEDQCEWLQQAAHPPADNAA